MSAHLVRNDGSKPNIMTTTAAQTNSASNIIPDHDVAMDAKKEGNTQSPGTKRTDKKSPEYLIKSGLAGGFAGCAAKTVVGPLDRVKILFQTRNPQFAKYTGSWSGFPSAIRDIYLTTGIRGLFKGHSATLLRIFPYAGIKFLAYEQIRARVIKNPSQETSIRRFLTGSAAGMMSVFLTYPLEVIRVRLAFETRAEGQSSLISIIRKIHSEKAPQIAQPSTTNIPLATTASHAVQAATPRSGLSNFFRGFTPTLLGMIPYAGASFLAHDSMSDLLRISPLASYTTLPNTSRAESRSSSHKPAQLRYWAELFAGGIAGFVSQTVSYPLEVIRRRMQVGGVVGDGRRLGILEVAGRIHAERGYKGFFVGLTIGYVKVVPMAAVSFYAYERGKYYLGI